MSRLIRFTLPLLVAGFTVAVAVPDEPKSKPNDAAPGDAVAFVSLDVAKAWEHRAFGAVREARGKLEFSWVVQSLFGVAPTEMERASAFWHSAGKDEPFVVITGRKALDAKSIVKALSRAGAKPPAGPMGKVIVAPGSEFPYLLQIDERTVLLAPQSADPTKLEAIGGKAGRLTAAIEAAGKHTLTIGLDVASIAAFPLPVGGPLLEAETAVLVADLTDDGGKAELRLTFAEPSQATKAAPFLKTKLDELAGWSAAQEKRSTARGQEGTGYPAPLLDWIAKTLKGVKVKADGKAAVATADLKIEEGITALLTAIPDAALAARGSSAAENNVKQIVLGMISYADANAAFPSNSYDKDGKALLSWRVHILPYIEQDNLYKRFKLDEPWDSDNNKPLSQLVVKVFAVPGRPAPQPWETYFRGFIGPKDVKPEHRPWLLEGQTKGPNFPAQFLDGTSNTFLVAEAAVAVPWAKPDDLPYDGVLALPKLGGPNGTYIVGFADGSVRTFRRGQIDDKNLRNLISVADGNVVNIPDR